ncbi:MAG: phenylacetate-CoA oxygenase subunit PaaI [Rhizobiales bacterium]|nr:phenylacetate-CoA oxygenase subunit PaaI [Hyphomicrobiales bacterium]
MENMEEFERKNPMDTKDSSLRMFKKDDPDMPPEFRKFMIKLLKYAHVENNANPHYRVLLGNIASAGLRYAPDGRAMTIEAEIIKQEVNHGQIVAKIIESLGEDPFIDKEIGQYAFRIPLESWTDVSWFHALIDRVGLYVGIEWMGSTYEPLAEVSEQLEKDEFFHAAAGMSFIKKAVKDPETKKEVQEQLHKWWPAALDMFGKSNSKNAEAYVKWGIKGQTNEELRQKYIADVVPMIEAMGLDVPDHLANRQYL